jgi:aminopeptidase N
MFVLSNSNHKAVGSQDLIDAFTTVLNQAGRDDFNFEKALRTWETQAGFPVITVSYISSSQNFRITQERFFENKNLGVNDTSSFYIPLNFATASNPNFEDTSITDFFIDGPPVKFISLPGFNTNQWFIFNKQQLGYYKVNYDTSNWEALSNALNNNFEKIHLLNRVQLIEDSFTLTNAGYLNDDYQTAFNILKYLVQEDDFFPWYSADRYLSTLFTAFGTKNEDLNVSIKTVL